MLKKKDIVILKKKLLDMREKIKEELEELENDIMNKSLKEASGELSSYSIHFADLGSDASERDTEIEAMETERNIMEKIEEALKRIEEGTYGKCQSCGNEIPLSRLRAIPYATLCKECKMKEEKSG
ncbi:TraR/DksA C4-type zinc finger protein [Candidatus Calescamantes bacterium]|nr:TraR/DksA C4-type zinc finger protein [Candidatus Calescamantes bacterium]